MELENRIENIRQEILKKIAESANIDNLHDIVLYTEILKQADSTFEALKKVKDEINTIEEKLHGISFSQYPIDTKNVVETILYYTILYYTKKIIGSDDYQILSENLSNKKRGKIKRQEFVQKLGFQGIKLIVERGVIYKTEKDKLVGIATSTERRRNRWFLGLPGNDYEYVILICEKADRIVLEMVLPRVFLQVYNNKFGKSNGQYKFNIISKGNEFYITLPRCEPISINNYINNFDLLR